MLKVGIISHMYPSGLRPTYGQFIHEHVKALQQVGVEVCVIAPLPWIPSGLVRFKRKWAAYAASGIAENFSGVKVTRPAYFMPPRPLHHMGAWGMAAALKCRWRKWLPEFDCDLIHAHAITPDGFAACKLANRLGRPVVCSARGSEVHQVPLESRTIRQMTCWTLQNSNATIAVSRALAQDAAKLGGAQVHPKVIYNGVSDVFQTSPDRNGSRRRLGFKDSAQIILFVGRCEYDKGVSELLEAFGSLAGQSPRAELVYIGDGSARHELAESAQRESWGQRVRFAGLLQRKEILQHLHAADVFVLPSHGEGMPNALLEAMASGLPCVATRVGGIPEAIEDGVNGLLIPVNSPPAIAAALRQVLDSPGLGVKIGPAARRTIQSHFTWSANAQSHLCVYEEAIRNFHSRQKAN